MPLGIYPAATFIPIPAGNYAKGRGSEHIYAVVDHVTDGTAASARSWFQSVRSGVSAHFLVDEYGHVDQFVNIFDTAYANGITYLGNGFWRDPDKNVIKPPWNKLQTYHGDPNRITVSIEHAGKPWTPWTPAMIQADALLLQWIAAETGIVYQPFETLIGHCHIGPKHRAKCPGPYVDYQAQANRGNYRDPATGDTIPLSPPLVRLQVKPGVIAVVREGTSRTYPPALGNDPAAQQELVYLEPGQPVDALALVQGTSYGGESRWAHLVSQIGFIHMSALEPKTS